MHLILAAPSVVAIVLLLCLFPYGVLRMVRRNVRSGSAGSSKLTAGREFRHLRRFIWRSGGKPLALLLVVQVLLLIHHHSLGPAHVLSQVFGEFHPEVALNAPDLEAWTEAYYQLDPVTGLSPALAAASRSVAASLVEHWPLYPVYLILAFLYLGYHFRRRFGPAVEDYRRGVLRRALRRDLRRNGIAPVGSERRKIVTGID